MPLRYFNDKSSSNTTNQSFFVSFAMHTAYPLLKLKHFLLLVMYSWLKDYYYEINCKHSITCSSLIVTNDVLVTKATPIHYIHSKCHINKLKSSKTCLIGNSSFVLFYVNGSSWPGGWGHTHKHTRFRIKMISRTRQVPACGQQHRRCWFLKAIKLHHKKYVY